MSLKFHKMSHVSDSPIRLWRRLLHPPPHHPLTHSAHKKFCQVPGGLDLEVADGMANIHNEIMGTMQAGHVDVVHKKADQIKSKFMRNHPQHLPREQHLLRVRIRVD
jgi:hypothetical protein